MIKLAISPRGIKCWFRDNKFHRTNGPARIWPIDNVEYWVNGELLNENEREYMHKTNIKLEISMWGLRTWWKQRLLHRHNHAAIIWSNGDSDWYVNGKKHRTDGPARIRVNGQNEYWFNDQRLTEYELMFINNSHG